MEPRSIHHHHPEVPMLTTTTVSRFEAMAGADYSWPGVSGDDRPGSGARGKANPRVGLRFWLWQAQGGVCPDCGEADDFEAMEACHVVSGGANGNRAASANGWYCRPDGCNLFVGHKECPSSLVNGVATRGNNAQRARGPVVRPSDLLRPDVIVEAGPYPTIGRYARHDPYSA